MALRGRCYDMNIKDIRKQRGARAIPIELDEPDNMDAQKAQDAYIEAGEDLDLEWQADEDSWNECINNPTSPDYIPPVNAMGELDSDICDPWDMACHQEPGCY